MVSIQMALSWIRSLAAKPDRPAPQLKLKREPVVTRRALALCGWPEQLDREIEERERTERLLAVEYPELFAK